MQNPKLNYNDRNCPLTPFQIVPSWRDAKLVTHHLKSFMCEFSNEVKIFPSSDMFTNKSVIVVDMFYVYLGIH